MRLQPQWSLFLFLFFNLMQWVAGDKVSWLNKIYFFYRCSIWRQLFLKCNILVNSIFFYSILIKKPGAGGRTLRLPLGFDGGPKKSGLSVKGVRSFFRLSNTAHLALTLDRGLLVGEWISMSFIGLLQIFGYFSSVSLTNSFSTVWVVYLCCVTQIAES